MRKHTAYEMTAAASSLLVFCATVVVMAIWLFNPELQPFTNPIKFNAALSLCFASLSLWFQTKSPSLLGRIFAAVTLAFGLLTTAEYCFGWNLGIDQWIVSDLLSVESNLFPGRMSPITSICLTLLGGALLTLDFRGNRKIHVASLLVLPTFFLCLFALAGYLFGATGFYTVGPYVRIAWQTACSILVLGVGSLFARPSYGFGAVLFSTNIGGRMMRRMLPVSIFIPLVYAWIRLQAEYAGYLNLQSGIAALTVSLITVLSTLTYFYSRSLGQVDQDRKESENTFRSIFELATVGMVRCSTKTGRFIDVNQRFIDLTGYSREELKSKSPWDITHPADRDSDVQGARKVIDSQEQVYRTEKRYLRKDGQVIWVKLEATVSARDVSGKPTETAACIIDVTSQKHALEEIKRSEVRFRSIFDSAMFGLILWTRTGEIFDANDEFLRLIGYTREDLVSGRLDWKALTPPEYADMDEAALNEVATTGKCTPYEKEYLHKDGTRLPIAIGAAVLPEVSGVGGVAFVLDNRPRKEAELARQTSETHFRTLSETIPQIVWTADSSGKFIFFNKRWMEYTGTPIEQVNQSGWDPLIHPEDVEAFKQCWETSLRSGEPYEKEYRLKRSDGSYRWHLRRSLPLKDSSNRILMWFGTCTDIHEQKAAYHTVVEAKNRIDAIVSNTDAVIFSINKQGIITYSEGHGLLSLGIKAGERVGKSVFEINKDKPELLETNRRALSGETFSIRSLVRDQWMEIHYNPIIDENGTPNGITGVAFNITSRVAAEQAHTETQDRLKAILKHVPFAFWAIDRSRKFIFREGIGMKAVGMGSQQMVGQSIDDIYRDHPHVLAAMDRAFSGEAFEVQTKIGELWYNVVFAPTRDSAGTVSGISGITFDITERKLLEEERTNSEVREKAAVETSRLKSEFLAHMSHEIRTPINGIMGMIGLLSDTKLETQQQDYVHSAKSSADALLTVVNDILDFSKVESGKLEFEDLDFDLPHLLKDVAKTFSVQAKSKGIALALNLEPQTPQYVGGDPGRLRQVLNNLLSNAVKFTLQGQVSIRVSCESKSSQENRIRVEVKDSGIGIPEAALSRMFRAFTQADASTSRRFGGTGLGLSISKHLVEQMGGTIGVESTEAVGTTFWFSLNLRAGKQPVVHRSQKVGNFKELTGRSLRILLAEDNAVNKIIAVKVLEKMGLKVDAVANGQEVLDALRTIPYDLILMDCQMPEMDGYEATRLIRASKTLPQTDIPIVAMTANALQGDRERCLAVGMNGYVSKPVSNAELFAVLSHWLLADEETKKAA
ncbi:PAS domain S-box protein [bacterium]|nr:PAS domain S-box protein [bacterium]